MYATRRSPASTSTVLGLLSLTALWACAPTDADRIEVSITFSDALEAEPLDGRLILVLARADGDTEPRLLVSAGQDAQPIFGLDVEAWSPGEPALFTDSVFGFPCGASGICRPARTARRRS